MSRWKLRIIIGFSIAFLAVVFPWWVWALAIIVVSVWQKPYWEGVLITLIFDLMYGGGLPGVGLFSIGNLAVRFWMIYVALFIILLLSPKQATRQVY